MGPQGLAYDGGCTRMIGIEAGRLMIDAAQNHSLPRAERMIPMELIERGTVKEVYVD